MFYHPKTIQRDFEYTSIKVSVKDTDTDELYMECIHVAAIAKATMMKKLS
ncbi:MULTISPECIES: hypothetical protein [Bacillus cereus group]|nr:MULTISPECIES: hypothetical protein [Bacillus cereus group]MED1286393.1 hypothetical protein [Bacillus mycoides]